MITYLNGKLVEVLENAIVLEAYGVGYEVFCSSHQFYDELGKEALVKVYVFEHIKEDGHDLYGFKTKEERELFKKLTSVSGIGPKSGIQILNTYEASEIASIILSEDSKALTKVSGIGAKTAQRIILELKDGISKLYETDLSWIREEKNEGPDNKAEAIEALVTLGYSFGEAKKAVSAVADGYDTSEQMIKKALSLLGL